jgi:hypothetical protein
MVAWVIFYFAPVIYEWCAVVITVRMDACLPKTNHTNTSFYPHRPQ